MWKNNTDIKELRQENIALKNKISGLEEQIMRFEADTKKIKELRKAQIDANNALYQIIESMQNLVSSLDEKEVMQVIEKLLLKTCRAESFQIFQNVDSVLKCVIAVGENSDNEVQTVIDPEEGCLIGWCYKNGQFISANNLDQLLAGLKNKGKVKTILCAPLQYEGSIFGVINISAFKEDGAESEVEKIFRMLSGLIGFVLKNVEKFTKTQHELASATISSQQQEKEKQKLEETFSKYVSAKVVQQILNNAEFVSLGGQRQIVTVLFADIRDFTKMAEKLDPEETVSMLNECLSEITEIILKYGGTLDKYIGDAVMAVFGAPVAMKDDVEKAVLAAVEIQKRLRVLQQKWQIEGKQKVQMGIGINTGEAIVGNVGSEMRMEYTAIGDNVNLAARLEELAKGGEIIISEQTYMGCHSIVQATKNEPVKVKGKSAFIQTYTVKSLQTGVDVNQYSKIEIDEQAVTMQYTQKMITDFATRGHAVLSADSSAEDKWAKGIKLATGKEYEKALDIFRDILKKSPENPKYYFSVGLVYFKMKKLKKAVAAFEKTVELKNDYKEAIAMLEKCKNIMKGASK